MMQFVIGLLSTLALIGVLCRLDGLSFRHHQADVVIFHTALGLGCVWSLIHVAERAGALGDACMPVATLCWLWMSLPTWAEGVPERYRRRADGWADMGVAVQRGK